MNRALLQTLAITILLLSVPAIAGTEVQHIKREDIVADAATLPDKGIVTTGQPDAAVLDAVAQAGFAAVIDFRGPNEDRGIDEEKEVPARGMRYFAIPVTGNDDV